MSETVKQFLGFVSEHYPRFRHLWITEGTRTIYDEEAVERHLATDSQGEIVILKCLLSIWGGNADGGKFSIDITDLATISMDAKKPLLEWMLNPFWP